MPLDFEDYDERTQTLTVSFGQRVYAYSPVPKDVANGFKMADAVGVSKGSYFQRYIKSRYKGRKVR